MKTLLVKPEQYTTIPVKEDTQFLLDLRNIPEANLILELQMATPGVSAEIYGFYTLTDSQKLTLTTIARHIAPHTSCMTRIKGILDKSASSSYIGKILIAKSAQQTSSYLSHDVLVIGNKTSNNSQPILEIDADDVKASHGATTGRIDEGQLYYLSTRGLDRDTARNLIIKGFFDSEMQHIKDAYLVEEVAPSLYKEV
ncbi:SufD family Fe-S cluster assembly protein [candidate division WWE3 bacterium]|uniref:SufD family Fe-S cluster assembly protein n=1 Tax=candidate division WWE3 bacterium TaxID=2053526 RepID=A0A7X9HGZ9_UNCKA|nr:SufD family Fe-S cluster assembly protein [candidate division WWE3 bacterium]